MEEINVEKIEKKFNEYQTAINYAICNYNTQITKLSDRYAFYYNELLEKVFIVCSIHGKEIDKWINQDKIFENFNLRFNNELLEKISNESV